MGLQCNQQPRDESLSYMYSMLTFSDDKVSITHSRDIGTLLWCREYVLLVDLPVLKHNH